MSGDSVIVRRSADRFAQHRPSISSWHSFSFGADYDPGNVSFGVLLVNNELLLEPGAAFPEHSHRDSEVVTWMLSGALTHRDSLGAAGELRAGAVQRMSAGTGVRHSETAGADGTAHFVQMWVQPDVNGLPPSIDQRDVGQLLAGGALVPVVSGMRRHGDAPVRLGCPDAALHVARLPAACSAVLPTAPYVHLFVPVGSVDLEGTGRLNVGDAARLADSEGRRVVAGGQGAEVLVWEMHVRP